MNTPIVNQGQRRPPSEGGSSTGGGGSGGGAATGTGANAAVSWAGTPCSSCVPAAWSASAKSSADCQRCAGSLARAAITTDSSAGLTSGRNCEIGGGCSDRCLSATDTALSPSNGSRPASIS